MFLAGSARWLKWHFCVLPLCTGLHSFRIPVLPKEDIFITFSYSNSLMDLFVIKVFSLSQRSLKNYVYHPTSAEKRPSLHVSTLTFPHFVSWNMVDHFFNFSKDTGKACLEGYEPIVAAPHCHYAVDCTVCNILASMGCIFKLLPANQKLFKEVLDWIMNILNGVCTGRWSVYALPFPCCLCISFCTYLEYHTFTVSTVESRRLTMHNLQLWQFAVQLSH